MSRMENFILDRGEAESYPEPRCELHDNITKEMAGIVAKLLPVGGRVLDVGTGQGPALEWFTGHGFDVRGIASNREDVAACVAKGYRVAFGDQNDLEDYNIVAGFDLVWARHVLEHSICPFWTLFEFNRILKPGGILYAEMPAPETSSHHQHNPNHYSVLGDQAWMSLICRSGFEIVEAKKIMFTTPNGEDIYYSFTSRKASP